MDIRLNVGFVNHPKTLHLKRLTGPDGVLCLIQFWSWLAVSCPSGMLGAMLGADIEHVAGWKGSPGVWVEGAIGAGFLEGDEGTYRVHDWEDHQGYVIHAKARSAKASAAASARWSKRGPDAPSIAPSKAQALLQAHAPLPAPSPAPLAEEKTPPEGPPQGGDHETPARPSRKRPKAPLEYPPAFLEVWGRAHPKMLRCGKAAAYGAWRKAMDAGRLPDQVTLIKALDRWRSEWEAQTDPFVAHLTTWLNNGRWDTGEDVAQAQAQVVAQERTQEEQAQAAERDRHQEVEAEWARKWEALPENKKQEWREYAARTNAMAKRAKEKGQATLLEVAGRTAWRRHREERERELKGGEGESKDSHGT